MPTPASAASADLHSQHVGADLPVKEIKAETHHEQQEFEAAGGKTEIKMEVGLSSMASCLVFNVYCSMFTFMNCITHVDSLFLLKPLKSSKIFLSCSFKIFFFNSVIVHI